MDLIKWLENPGREYTPVPFWFLNGELRNSEIRRQLQDFHNHGVYGVVLPPRIGLPRRIGYLSPRFFSYIRTAVETAAELNMTQPQYWRYEQGYRDIPTDVLIRLAKMYETSVDYILELSDDSRPPRQNAQQGGE